ncbi:hypothetical protein AB0H45_16955 [Streptomyces atroolivaceus]|uniref:hypothetical protein n=1 Tax=Streptomyces atroolivaceus TaxID=66869 RepID=UPI0033E1B7E0
MLGRYDLDLTGALRCWDRDPEGAAAVIRLRVLALYGVQSSAGVGPSRVIAGMAAAVTPPGAATIVGNTPIDVAAFRGSRCAFALPAWGRLPRVLTRYGINTVGDIADTPLAARSATQAGSGRGLPPAKPAAP